MATAAPDLKPIREPSITDAFDIGQVDRLIELVKELADSPGKEILPNGKRRKDALLQVRYAAAVLHDFDRFDQTASFIYSDNNLELFLKEILYALPRLRQELLNVQGAAPESTIQEVVGRAEQIVQEAQERGEKKHRYHDIHELLKENISRAEIHALLNKQREQVILEHLETTEALTARLTSHIEATKAHVANTILSQTNFMEQLVPLLPQGEADQARYFLAEHLSGGIQDELVNTNVILRSDVSPGKIKVGVLKALEKSPEGEAIARYLDANPQSLDLLSRTIIENHAEELAKAARYSRSIGRIFESVGGDRLETLIQETQGHLNEEILDEIRKTLGIDPSKILTTKHLGNDIQKVIEESAALAGRDSSVQRGILKRFLLDNQRRYPFLRTQRDIDALVANMAKRSSKLASYLASAKRLQRLGYSKGLASENTFLLGSIREEDFPRQLLALLGDWKHLSVGDVTLRIDAFFNKRRHRDLLLTLLSLDEKTLTALKAEYLTMRGFPQNTKEFWRALKILSYIEQVESFKKELAKNPFLSRKLWNFWRNNLPESTKGKNFQPFLKNLLEVGAPNYYNERFSQKVFTRGDQPYAGPSVTSPSFAYISNFLTNLSSIEKRWQSRIFSTDIVYRKGVPKLTSQLKTGVNRVLSKGVLGGIKRGLKGLTTRLGIGTLLGGIAGALAGIVAGPLLKHWKKIAAGIVGGGLYLLSQLLGSLTHVVGVAGGALAGGVIGFIITGGNPLGFFAGAAISGAIQAFIYVNFGGWGGAFSALGTTVSGFLTGLQLSAAGLAAGATAAIGGIFTSVIGVATAATLAIVGIATFVLTLVTTIPNPFQQPVGGGGDIAQCTFYRSGDKIQGLKIGNLQMAALITDVSTKVVVPATIVAGIMRVETASALSSTDPTYIVNDYDAHSSGAAYGVMQFTIPTFFSTFDANRAEVNSLFGKTDVRTIIDSQSNMAAGNILRIYSIKDSITAAAFKVKNDKKSINGDGPWDQPTVYEIARRYYGCLLYDPTIRDANEACRTGRYNYGEDLWKSYTACQAATSPFPVTGVLASCPVQDPYIIANGTKNNPVPGRGGHCDPSYTRSYPFWCPPRKNPGVANAIDVSAKNQRSLLATYLPTLEGKSIKWKYEKGNYTDSNVPGIGYGHDFTTVVDGHSYFLHLFHLDQNPNLVKWELYDSTTLVGNMYNMGGPHLHFTISKDGTEQEPHVAPPNGMGMCSNQP